MRDNNSLSLGESQRVEVPCEWKSGGIGRGAKGDSHAWLGGGSRLRRDIPVVPTAIPTALPVWLVPDALCFPMPLSSWLPVHQCPLSGCWCPVLFPTLAAGAHAPVAPPVWVSPLGPHVSFGGRKMGPGWNRESYLLPGGHPTSCAMAVTPAWDLLLPP